MAERCVLIINKMSGRTDKLDIENLTRELDVNSDCDIIYLVEKSRLEDLSSYDKIIACGGDGTLNGVLNCKISPSAEVVYVPYGTLNETAAYMRRYSQDSISKVGRTGKDYFSYVCASGSFTPLGYKVGAKSKKRFKFLAYLKSVIGEYKIWNIPARIELDGRVIDGPFTLIMAINSPSCFRFRFNKMFDPDGDGIHLLLIKSPKRRGIAGAAKMFFLFFRAFFIGFKKLYDKKNMLFLPVRSFDMSLESPTAFDLDGELYILEGDLKTECLPPPFTIKIYAPKKS